MLTFDAAVTETTWYMCTEAVSLDVLHEQPLYLFIHLDEEQTPRCYWTFSPEPLSEEDAALEQRSMNALGCPEPIMYARRSYFHPDLTFAS